jgi:hypothetical protein
MAYRLIQATEDATARAIGTDQILQQMELWVRSQFRRGYADAETYAQIMDDIAQVRRQIAGHKDELARLRRGEMGD